MSKVAFVFLLGKYLNPVLVFLSLLLIIDQQLDKLMNILFNRDLYEKTNLYVKSDMNTVFNFIFSSQNWKQPHVPDVTGRLGIEVDPTISDSL